MRETNNLFADIPSTMPEELIEVLAENNQVRIERIVSTGHASPDGFWYDQDDAEWVVIIKGEARLLFDDDAEPITMCPGDHTLIPAHRKHRVEWTTPNEPTVWLAVFIREENTASLSHESQELRVESRSRRNSGSGP